jgi:hypothetical protein
MARKQSKPKGRGKASEPPPVKKNLVAIRGYEAWGHWLDEFASRKGMPVTVLIDQALREMAKRDGFRDPPARF